MAPRATLRLRLNIWLCFSLGVQLGDLLPVWRWPSERSLATLSLSGPLCVADLSFLVPHGNGGSLDCLKDRITSFASAKDLTKDSESLAAQHALRELSLGSGCLVLLLCSVGCEEGPCQLSSISCGCRLQAAKCKTADYSGVLFFLTTFSSLLLTECLKIFCNISIVFVSSESEEMQFLRKLQRNTGFYLFPSLFR